MATFAGLFCFFMGCTTYRHWFVDWAMCQHLKVIFTWGPSFVPNGEQLPPVQVRCHQKAYYCSGCMWTKRV